MKDSTDSSNTSPKGYLPLILNVYVTHICSMVSKFKLRCDFLSHKSSMKILIHVFNCFTSYTILLLFPLLFIILSLFLSLFHCHCFQLVVLLPEIIEITSFICSCRINYSSSKVKFRQASNLCKRVLVHTKLPLANKTK